MIEIFKAQLKAKSTAAGAPTISNARLEAMASKLNAKFPELTDPAEHEAKIDDFYDADMFKEIQALDHFQKAKAERDAAKKKEPEKKGEPEKETAPEETPTEKLLKELLGKVNKLEAEKTQGTIRQQLAAKLKDVPADFYEDWQLPADEAGVDAFTERVTTKWGAVEQGLREKGLINTKPSGGSAAGNGNGKATDAEIKNITKAIMPRT